MRPHDDALNRANTEALPADAAELGAEALVDWARRCDALLPAPRDGPLARELDLRGLRYARGRRRWCWCC